MKTKAAWKRDEDGKGHFDCECGKEVKSGLYGDGIYSTCQCGRRYDSKGWIVSGEFGVATN